MTGSPDATMTETQFRHLVTRELNHQATEDEIAWLKHPTNLPRWREMLVTLRSRVEGQIERINQDMLDEHQRCMTLGPEGKQIWFSYKSNAEKQRSAAGNFIRKVQLRLSLIRRLRQQQAIALPPEEVAYWRARARSLAHLCHEIMEHEIAKPAGNNWILVQRIQTILADSSSDAGTHALEDGGVTPCSLQ